MPKMTDSRRKKIQARQRQARAALRREKKAARRAQRSAKLKLADGPQGSLERPITAPTGAP
ncbi:MAG TPA: hypothetical protein VMR94_03820 [Hyphomicrobiaceae bacterium]|nr:hypothetical protein [Hyphomicrobiaceae bacterium]